MSKYKVFDLTVKYIDGSTYKQPLPDVLEYKEEENEAYRTMAGKCQDLATKGFWVGNEFSAPGGIKTVSYQEVPQ